MYIHRINKGKTWTEYRSFPFEVRALRRKNVEAFAHIFGQKIALVSVYSNNMAESILISIACTYTLFCLLVYLFIAHDKIVDRKFSNEK